MGWSQERTIIAPLVANLVLESVGRGVTESVLLEALGVSKADLSDQDRRISAERLYAAWEIALRQTRDAGLPIDVGRRASVGRFGVLGFALYTSRTFEESLEVLRRHHDLINDTGRWDIEQRRTHVVVRWLRDGEARLGLRAANEQAMASFPTICAAVFEAPLPLVEVRFSHARPSDIRNHVRHFGGPIRWEAGETALIFDQSALHMKPRMADSGLAHYFQATAEATLQRIAPDASWTSRVARLVSNMLPAGMPSLEVVAAALDTSPRTLRRRLNLEGVAFRVLLERVQRERAAELMKGTTRIRDIAFALGFSDATAFSRAYRRWTGKAPSARRESPPTCSARAGDRSIED